jgi:hypothetical protein
LNGCGRKGGDLALGESTAIEVETKAVPVIPDTVKFLLAVGLVAGAAYGAVWGLANFPPETSDIVRALPHEKLRQN